MSAPIMQVKAVLFLSKAPVRLTRTADNRWQLTLLAVHRIANHQTEPWRLVWTGDEAEAFARRHQDDLKPGQAVHIAAHQLRAHSVGALTEIVAAVTRIEVQACAVCTAAPAADGIVNPPYKPHNGEPSK